MVDRKVLKKHQHSLASLLRVAVAANEARNRAMFALEEFLGEIPDWTWLDNWSEEGAGKMSDQEIVEHLARDWNSSNEEQECPECHKAIPDDATFCPECGADLSYP